MEIDEELGENNFILEKRRVF